MRNSFFTKLLLVFTAIILPLSFLQIFDFFYSKNTPQIQPFRLRDPISNGKPLIVSDEFGWYDLGPYFNGESRYGKKYFFVKTDKNGFRINHLENEEIPKKSFREDKILFIGDSFTFGVGLNWEETFVGILNKDFNLNAINAGVNSYSPTVYKYKLRNLIKKGLIDSNQKIVIGLDISDVFDESTRWTEYKGRPANIEKVQKLKNLPFTDQIIEENISTNHKKLKQSNFYNKKNFKLTYQIYYGLENFVKNYFDDIQVRNNARSKFTHKEWSLIEDKYSPLGIEEGFKKIRENLIQISQLVSDNNNDLYLLIYPWPAQLAYENSFNWETFTKNLCIEISCTGVINAFPYFESYKNNRRDWQKELYIKGDMHFNKKGNYILAEIIASEFEKE